MRQISALALFLALAACQTAENGDLVEMLGTENINQDIVLIEIEPLVPSPVAEGTYEMMLRNNSATEFVMSDGLEVQLLLSPASNGEWIETENRFSYLPEDQEVRLGARDTGVGSELAFTVWPALAESHEYSTLRVVIRGKLSDGGVAAAFTDIELAD